MECKEHLQEIKQKQWQVNSVKTLLRKIDNTGSKANM